MGVWEDNLHVTYVLNTLTQTNQQLSPGELGIHAIGVKRVNIQVPLEQPYVRNACLVHTVKGDLIQKRVA